MGLFQKDLPVNLCPLADNPEGVKYQGVLKDVTQEHMVVDTGHSLELAQNSELRVEFRLKDANFRFETTIANLHGQRGLLLKKPSVIHRSKVREGPRVDIPLEVQWTPWTSKGRFTGTVLDISESGMRMRTAQDLTKGALISLDFYIKEAKSRVITQGLIVWVREDEQWLRHVQCGVQFTTITNEARKKLAKHFSELSAQQARESESPA